MAEEYAEALANLPMRLAELVAQTYEVMGDGALLSDDTALYKIHDLLDELDEALIEQASVKIAKQAKRKRKLAG